MCEESLSDCRIAVAVARQIDQICDQYEQAWRSGLAPSIDQFVKQVSGLPELESSVLFRELLELELYYRRRARPRGAVVDEDYRSRFPQFATVIDTVFRSTTSSHQATDKPEEPMENFDSDESAKLAKTLPQYLRDYALLTEIGRGAMGTVYRARHTKLDRIVALKVLPRERTQDAQAVARFEREQRAVGQLDHPNIVRATDAGVVEGEHFLVMEFVDGVDLERLVRRLGQLAIADACEIIRQAAVGLQHAHEHDLVHRDIKPSNLMLTIAGIVKVLDLGLAKLRSEKPASGDLTRSDQIMGTVHYMAPEQAVHTHNVDIRADIYSLGCTLYKLLTRHAPFANLPDATPLGVVMAHANDPFPPIQEQRPDVPDRLAEVLDRMVAKAPKDRPARPAEVATLLTSFCAEANLPLLVQRVRTASGEEENEDKKAPPPQPPPLPPDDDQNGIRQEDETAPPIGSTHLLPPERPPLNEQSDRAKSAGWRTPWAVRAGILILVALAGLLVWSRWPSTNLIDRLDPQRDAAAGDWRVEQGILISPKTEHACLRLPEVMPAQFQLEITAERQEGLELVLANISHQTPFAVAFGVQIVVVGEQKAEHQTNNSNQDAPWRADWGSLADPSPRQILVTAKQNHLTVQRDGAVIVDETGDLQRFRNTLPDYLPDRPGFYLCTNRSEYRFHQIRCRKLASTTDSK